MDREKLQAMLADYLAGELDPESAKTFEAALADHPDLAEEAASLGRTLSMIRGLEWTAAGRDLIPSRKPGRTLWPRFAAALVLAFAAGFLARSFLGDDQGRVEPPEMLESAISVPDDDWRQTFSDAYAERTDASRLARSLIALSRCF